MPDSKFMRINDKLYEEHPASGSRPLKWAKEPEPLYLELYDVTAVDGVAAAMKTPSFFTVRTKDGDSNGPDEFATTTADPSQLRAIKEIRAKGKVANDRNIGFIDTEGLTGSRLLDRPT